MELILRGTPEELSQFFSISETQMPSRIIVTPKYDNEVVEVVQKKEETTTTKESMLLYNECEKILKDEWQRLVPFIITWFKKRGVNPDESWIMEELKLMPTRKRHILLSRAKAASYPSRRLVNDTPWGLNAVAKRLCIDKHTVSSTCVNTVRELAYKWKERKKNGTGSN